MSPPVGKRQAIRRKTGGKQARGIGKLRTGIRFSTGDNDVVATFLTRVKTPDELRVMQGRGSSHSGILKVDFENHHLEVPISLVVSWTGLELPVNFEHNPASLSAPPPSPP